MTKDEKLKKEKEDIEKYPDRPVSQSAYARYAGITRQSVGDLVRRGIIELNSKSKVIPRQADKAREAIQQVRVDEDSEDLNNDNDRYRKARADKEESMAETARMKLLELQGQLVSREAVDTWVYLATQAATKSLENLPRILATELAMIQNPHEIQRKLSEQIQEILTELSRKLNSK